MAPVDMSAPYAPHAAGPAPGSSRPQRVGGAGGQVAGLAVVGGAVEQADQIPPGVGDGAQITTRHGGLLRLVGGHPRVRRRGQLDERAGGQVVDLCGQRVPGRIAGRTGNRDQPCQVIGQARVPCRGEVPARLGDSAGEQRQGHARDLDGYVRHESVTKPRDRVVVRVGLYQPARDQRGARTLEERAPLRRPTSCIPPKHRLDFEFVHPGVDELPVSAQSIVGDFGQQPVRAALPPLHPTQVTLGVVGGLGEPGQGHLTPFAPVSQVLTEAHGCLFPLPVAPIRQPLVCLRTRGTCFTVTVRVR